MAPLPKNWKEKMIPALKKTSLGRVELAWKAGNLGLVARIGGA
jgi:hypothetical protein